MSSTPMAGGLTARKLYLDALQDNQKARGRLQDLQESTSISTRTPDNDIPSVLLTHLKVLKFQAQHDKLLAILHCITQAEQIADEHQIFNHRSREQGRSLLSRNKSSSLADPSREYSELTKNLELVIIQANMLLQSQKKDNKNLKSQIPDTDMENDVLKIGALIATRAELTAWLESSLTRCDTTTENLIAEVKASHNALKQSEIDERYKAYNGVRMRLLSAATQVSKLPSAISLDMKQPTSTAVQIDEHDSVLAQIENRIQSLLSQSTHIERHQHQLDKSLSELTKQLATELGRLRDESHLLHLYPLPGNKLEGRGTRNIGDWQSSDVDDIARLLNHWKLAHDAAVTATATIIEIQFAHSSKTTNITNEAVDTVYRQGKAWEYLDTSQG